MDPTLSLTELKKTLECAICLDILRNPRRLACEHSFCKDCIDNLLEFDTFGNCTIKCPKQCKKLTSMMKDETANELGIDYIVRGILGMVAVEDQRISPSKIAPSCEASSNCEKDIANYCSSCNILLCATCTCSHSSDEYQHVSYSIREKRTKVMCKKHKTEAKWVCCQHYFCQNDFLCVYCKHREHRGHVVKSIQSQATELREKLVREIRESKEVCKTVEKLLQQAEMDISATRTLLEETLQYRKFLCLDRYIQEMDKEEKRINAEFEKVASKHREQFSYKDWCGTYEDLIEKDDVAVALRTKNIYNLLSSSRPSVREELVGLTDHHFNTEQPLGQITVKVGSRVNSEGSNKSLMKCNIPSVGMADIKMKVNMYNTLQGRLQHSFPAAYLAQEKANDEEMRVIMNEEAKTVENDATVATENVEELCQGKSQ